MRVIFHSDVSALSGAIHQLYKPLAERPLAVGNSTSGLTTCTSNKQEAKSGGVAHPPRHPERPVTRERSYYCY
jgi:hypothetical protein